MMLVEYAHDAVRSLRTTKTRSLLTMLGVAIGVGSITTILALSGGLTQIIARQVSDLGGNIAIIRPGSTIPSANFTNPITQQNFSASSLTENDVAAIQSVEHVKAVAPLMVINGTVQATASSERLPSTIVATTPALAELARLKVRDGQFLDSDTNRDTAIIGQQLSVDLFGTEQSIGRTLKVRDQTLTVIGILRARNDPINFNNIDFDNSVIVDFETGKAFHKGVAQIQQIDLSATQPQKLPGVLRQVEAKLLKNHLGERDFTLISGDKIAEPTNRLFILVTAVMTVIAAISLIVGGIGIMNIMLVGVAERTREIGIRKAVGASNGDILRQFMTESLIISLCGGVIGYIGGNITALMVSRFLAFTPALSWQIALSALSISFAVGLIFGLYPAIRAASKDPIESLRRYN